MFFSNHEAPQVRRENPNYGLGEVAKELGRRWAEMDPGIKQRYQQRAEEERQKYDNDMANYRQGNLAAAAANNSAGANTVVTPATVAVSSPANYTVAPGQDYSTLLQ